MKDSTAFVAGCAAAGALVLLMLLTRSGAGRISDSVQPPQDAGLAQVQPVPLPPPPTVSEDSTSLRELETQLNQQKELTNRLQSQLEQQQALTQDLRTQLERQQDDTDAILSQLQDYRHSMETMAAQQTRLAEAIPQASDTQTVMLWGIVGLFLFLLVGGGGVLTVFAIWLLQSQQRQRRNNTVIYPMPVPNPYQAYGYQTLPPSPRPQRVVQYDVQDYAD